MEIGLAYNLCSEVTPRATDPEDALAEYDSESTISAIAQALERKGHIVRRLGYGPGLLRGLLDRRPDFVFNIAEGVGGRSREAHVPSVLEMLGIPYTHSDPLTLAASQDTGIAKRIVASHGVATPRFCVVSDARELTELPLCFPLFAKPLFEGSSIGIRKHSRFDAHEPLVRHVQELLFSYREPVLVEEFCPGREFSVGVLGTGDSARVLGVSSITPLRVPTSEFVYSLDVKQNERWFDEIAIDSPPRCEGPLLQKIERLALSAYRALGCRDVGRVDIRLDAQDAPCFLELNALPGLSPGWSDLSIIAEGAKLSYEDLILAIFESARQRYGM
jgi:D-alanine-D-alanine ligase